MRTSFCHNRRKIEMRESEIDCGSHAAVRILQVSRVINRVMQDPHMPGKRISCLIKQSVLEPERLAGD